MPTYHYRCPNGHDFEHFERKITDRSRTKCPTCGKMAQRQISGGAGLLFKGSGFYATDYKKSGATARESAESKDHEEKPKTPGPTPKTDSSSSKPAQSKGSDS
jgi:putative FmdB family regulatory protein